MAQTAGRPISHRAAPAARRAAAARAPARSSASRRCSTTAASSRTRSASSSPSRCSTRSTSCCAASRPRTTPPEGELLREPLAEHPDEVYRALLTVILRLVFLLYAEERDMLPRGRDVPALLLARRPVRAPARGRRALPGHDGPALRRLGAAPRPLPAWSTTAPSAGAMQPPAAPRRALRPRPLPVPRGPHGAAARARSTSGSSRRSCPTGRSTARSRSCSSSTASGSPTARSTSSRSARSTRR